jgi:endonuclease III
MISRARREAPNTLRVLQATHPDAHCELDHKSTFELLVAVVLSAQSTDVGVNLVTPTLFDRWPTPELLSTAPIPEVERVLSRLGMFRQKAKNIVGLARKLTEEYDGQVPRRMDQLIQMPGVGRKTANVVLGVAFNAAEGVVVDTHVQRLAQRLGWTRNPDPVKIEQDLMRLFPQPLWDPLAHTLIFHGRRICTARSPACGACPVNGVCPSAFKAERVGRKPARRRSPQSVTKPKRMQSARPKSLSARPDSARASSDRGRKILRRT